MPAKISFSTAHGSEAAFRRVLGGNSQFAQDVIKRGAVVAREKVQKIGEEAVAEVERRVSELYEPRSDIRHKYNAVHLHGSFYYELESGGTTSRGNPTFPFTVVLKSDADPKHVMALNRGSGPHEITPKRKPFLALPRKGLGESPQFGWGKLSPRKQPSWLTGAPGRVRKPLQHSKSASSIFQASKSARIRVPLVKHPGVRASYFMEYALEVAADRVLRTKVKMNKGR